MASKFRTFAGMLDLLFPIRCVICATTGAALCRDCLSRLPPAPDLDPPLGMTSFGSIFAYESLTKELVAAFKYRGRKDLIPIVGTLMAALVDKSPAVITWAPTTPRHRRDRGYDQAELLALAVADVLAMPCRKLLKRENRSGQTGLDREARLGRPRFSATRPAAASVLVVDDVRTTGATLSAAAEVLSDAGAVTVTGLTLAVTL